jgi:ATP-dependent protease HslVU (ClpYQ) peptidase subunit
MASAGRFATTRKDRKVFEVGEYLIGFTTSFRMGQILMHGWEPPQPPRANSALFGFMVTDFVDSVRQRFKGGGFGKVENGEETGGAFLIAVRGRLFEIEEDYQVGETCNGFAAVGCGREVALGSLFSTKGNEPRARVVTALKAAEEFSTSVRGPFTVLHT